MRALALTLALAAAACGGSETKTAEYPATTTTTTTTAIRKNVAAQNTPATGVGYETTTAPSDATAANGSSTSAQTTMNAETARMAAAPPSNGSTYVAQNPGVADGTSVADNTKINDRDRKSNALTPMDQGNSGSETKVTAAIRKSVMGEKSLSFGAKNVKIITTGNRVTLRGPVKTDAERATIESIAKQTPGVTEVDNQIEVKR